ncbi:MAG TPA: hypothetical protein PJ982_19610, partial [Lacipirellulaceae bacterium]|nr:hypothetical protein [Lacipirellulaceae bacterium]
MPENRDEDIGPPFTEEEVRRIREILDEAGIDPSEYISIPQTPDPNQPPGWFIDPNIPRTPSVKENYNGQWGDGTFDVDRERG